MGEEMGVVTEAERAVVVMVEAMAVEKVEVVMVEAVAVVRVVLLGGGGQPLSAVTHGGAFDELPPAGGLISRAGLACDSTSHLHTTTSTPRQQARSKDGTVAWASRLYDELLAGNA